MSWIAEAVRSALNGQDVLAFLQATLTDRQRVLFVGNVGFSADTLYFASQLRGIASIDFRFFFEFRPDVPAAIDHVAQERIRELAALLGDRPSVHRIEICAADGAPVAGRNACREVQQWIEAGAYTDVVIDATGMSRGTCFPVAKLLVELGRRRGLRIHLLVAKSSMATPAAVRSISSDRADWIHGFQGDVDTDARSGALKLWVVQLHEDSDAALGRLFTNLQSPEEVCPIVPFPSADPRRGDELLFALRNRWRDDWAETPLSLIYADESDPTDVYRSISELHEARQSALRGSAVDTVTVLSPLGTRLPSIGMLLAALEHGLPLYYLETVGYKVQGQMPTGSVGASPSPDHLWCFRFLPP